MQTIRLKVAPSGSLQVHFVGAFAKAGDMLKRGRGNFSQDIFTLSFETD